MMMTEQQLKKILANKTPDAKSKRWTDKDVARACVLSAMATTAVNKRVPKFTINTDEVCIVTEVVDKKTNEKQSQKVFVSWKVIRSLYYIIKRLATKKGATHEVKFSSLVDSIIAANKIVGVDTQSFYGGRNRAKYYFPLYYNPVRVLAHLKLIEYSKRGIMFLNKKASWE
jgi:hypothetical protein